MATLKELAKSISDIGSQRNHAVLIYGPPKAGKSVFVGTAAKIKEIRRIFWFDLENGIDALANMGLTDEEMDKVIVIKVPNTRDNPIAIETMLKSFSAKEPVKICDEHGKVSCTSCKGADKGGIMFSLGTCNHTDLVVIDSGSELGDSALTAACLGKGDMFKPGFDEYGASGKWLGDIMSVVQQCKNTNFVIITHEIALEDDEGKDKIFPLLGTKPFSMKVAKYFGTVVYMFKKMGRHQAASSSTFRPDILTGSRVNAKLDGMQSPSMRDILVTGGIIKEGITTEAEPSMKVAANVIALPEAEKPLTALQQRLLNKKQ